MKFFYLYFFEVSLKLKFINSDSVGPKLIHLKRKHFPKMPSDVTVTKYSIFIFYTEISFLFKHSFCLKQKMKNL